MTKPELQEALTDITINDMVQVAEYVSAPLQWVLDTFGDKLFDEMVAAVSGYPIDSPFWAAQLAAWHAEGRL